MKIRKVSEFEALHNCAVCKETQSSLPVGKDVYEISDKNNCIYLCTDCIFNINKIYKKLYRGFLKMEMLKKYSEKYGLKNIINDMGECKLTSERNIIFSNGWIASITKNCGVKVFYSNGIHETIYDSDKKYSIAIYDYNGYFDWDILNQYGGINGCIYCDTELEVILACEIIRQL